MATAGDQVVFGAGDYAVFAVMLAVSLGIGIYYSIRDRGAKNNVQNYLMAGRKMNFWAVGMSLSFSFISAVTILGIPSEIYMFGSMYLWLLCCLPPLLFVVNEIYIPLYFRLNITSSYEYLEMRFNYAVRILGTLAYVAQTVLYIGVMIYAPSLAFSQVSGFNLWAAIFTTGIVCTIYTTLGGLKAVIWTDVFQGAVVVVILVIVLFMSANDSGGWYHVWLANDRTNRFDFFHFELDPRFRHSFWSVVVGLSVLWISIFASTQSQVQRYLACSSIADAKKSMTFGLTIALFVVLMCAALGWVMFAFFQDCDPVRSGQVTAPDQLLPLMVMRLFRDLPGLSGAFMAGVYAGCLSTVSSGINAMACVVSEDFIRPFVKWTDSTLTIVAKVLVFVFGLITIGFACLSSVLGNVLQASLTLLGILGGPTLGIYTLGAVFPFANVWGSVSGFFVGLILVSWIYGGSRQYPPAPKFWNFKARAIAGCPTASLATESVFNVTVANATEELATTVIASTSEISYFTSNATFNPLLSTTPEPVLTPTQPPAVADFYAVSYAYYCAIGMGATLVFGLIISLLTCGHRHAKDIDPKLVVPLLDHKLFIHALPKKFRKMMWCGIDRDRQEQQPSKVPVASIDIDVTDGKDNLAFENTGV